MAGRHEAALPVLPETEDRRGINPAAERYDMIRLSQLRGCGLAIVGLTGTHHAAAQELPPSAIEARNTQVPAAPVATPYPDAAAGDGNMQQGCNPLRWAEDWRGTRDPAKRDDVFDRLKWQKHRLSIGHGFERVAGPAGLR